MSYRNSSSGHLGSLLTNPLSRRLLRRVAWVAVLIGAAYTGLILTWIFLDPRW